MNIRFSKTTLIGLLVSGICLHWPGLAQGLGSQLNDLYLDETGNLILEVEGDGFDPLLRLQTEPGGHYSIVLEAENVRLNPSIQANIADFNQQLARQLPAVASVRFFQESRDQLPVVRIVLDSTRKLQPQVRSNSGRQVVITLIGDQQSPVQAFKSLEVPKSETPKKPVTANQTSQPVKANPIQNMAQKWLPKKANTSAMPQVKPVEVLTDANHPAVKPPPITFSKMPEKTANQFSTDDLMTKLTSDRLPDGEVTLDKTGKPYSTSSVKSEPIRLKATPTAFPSDTYVPSAGVTVYTTGQNSIWSPYKENNPALQQAWQSAQQGQTASAELALKSYLERNPYDANAHFMLGQLYISMAMQVADEKENQTRMGAAQQSLLKANAQGQHLPATLALLDLYLQQDKTLEAEQLLNQALKQWPNENKLTFYKGKLSEASGDQDAARQAYEKLLKEEPDNLEAHYRFSMAALKTGNLELAKWELSQALRLAPDDARLWKLMGFIAEKQQAPENAQHAYMQALNPDVMINLARLLEAQKQTDKALAIYQTVSDLVPNDADIQYNLGMIYAGMKQDERAEISLKRFLELQKNNPDSRLEVAQNTLKDIRKRANAGKAGLGTKILPF